MTSNEELLQIIKQLRNENKQLHEANKELNQELKETKDKLNETELKLYNANKQLNEVLLKIADLQEKEKISRTSTIIPKSEKVKNIVLNETEETLKEEKKERASNKGKKYKKKAFDYEKYVTETRIIEPDEKTCPTCGATLVEVSSKIRYVVEIVPEQIKVTKLIKKSMKCPNCNKKDNKIYYPLADPFSGSILSTSLLSYILYYKYELGVPFEHLANHMTKTVGFEISKQNLANYAAKGAKMLENIYLQMLDDLKNSNSKVLHSDETTLVVSRKPEDDKNRKESYVYVYTSSYYDKNQIRIYDFHESRSIGKTTKWLNDYSGYIICDAYVGYDSLVKSNPNIKLQRCWAHVRRRFASIVKNLPKAKRNDSDAYKILLKIGQLFKFEKEYREANLTPDQILEKRKGPEIQQIKNELEQQLTEITPHPNSALAEAINYTKNCWDDLFTYLEDGHLEMTNNNAERAVKPFVVRRKVFQTSGSYAGAKYTTIIFSIIQTALINNLNIEKYLNYVFTNIKNKPVDELLPYSEEIRKNIGN